MPASGDPSLVSIELEETLKLKDSGIKDIFQSEDKEALITVVNFLFNEIMDDSENSHLTVPLARTYLNLYRLGCEEGKENIEFADKAVKCFERDLNPETTPKAVFSSYYNALQTIILKTQDFALQDEMIEKLKPKIDMTNVYSELIKRYKGTKKVVEFYRAKGLLIHPKEAKKADGIDDSLADGFNDLFPSERDDKNRINEQESNDEITEVVILQDKSNGDDNAKFLKIKDALIDSDELKKLRAQGSGHNVKALQISDYLSKIGQAKNLEELETAVNADPKAAGNNYSMRQNTAILGMYSLFHQGKSTTDTLALDLKSKLDDIIREETKATSQQLP